MKITANGGAIDEILHCFDKIKTIELAMDSLQNEYIPDFHERVKIKEKRKRLGAEIMQIRGILRNKMRLPATSRRVSSFRI